MAEMVEITYHWTYRVIKERVGTLEVPAELLEEGRGPALRDYVWEAWERDGMPEEEDVDSNWENLDPEIVRHDQN